MAEETMGGFVKLPKRSLIYILVCAGGILCFLGIGILPNQRALSILDEEASGVEFELQTQKTLFPVFRKAMQALHEEKKDDFDLPETARIDLKDINSISPFFRELALTSGLGFKSGFPDAGKINKTSGTIPFTLELEGPYFDFRRFLTQLVLVPYLDHIETVDVSAESGMKEYRLRINLSAGNGTAKK